MKIFITGALGFLGSNLLPKLQNLGHEIVTDMRYLHTRKYHVLIHLASKNNIKNEFDPELIESNYILTKEVFKINTRIIYASSCVAAYPLNPYAYSKLYAEHLGSIHGNTIGLRFNNCYGPNNRKGIVWHLMGLSDGAKLNVRGIDLIRDYIFVEDVVDEIIRHIKPDGKFLDLRHAREKAKEDGRDLQEVIKEFKAKGNLEHLDLNASRGVVDVGTGIGTSTIDLVNLFQKISGREFDISVSELGDNEPLSMVADHAVPHIDLKTGLTKMLEV